ncbi:type IX secretion system periplasmic lipoprotein PorW/SprE [Riemerella columbipharyngis]|uniref:Tetratricopeptide repeat-containing protein n=1 Tax=Riemerella columbipharyngis TaxID=1071918 RepID=A0A1G7ESG9_9FLAO|nr:tetratricopeptide repeat protein [Riemerella columbipharyngis]SDE66436.1 Tetratricopeptide repeat-containing protein [Riemerella columbipharyngis]
MKKYDYYLIAVISVLAVGCSAKKNAASSRVMQPFFTYYNTLFNSKDALETETNNRDKTHKDNFYEPYISIFTYEDDARKEKDGGNTQAADFSPEENGGDNAFIPPRRERIKDIDLSPDETPSPRNNKRTVTILQIAEAKALKAIAQHSMLFRGEEKNKEIFNASILLCKSRLYQGKYLQALDALNYIFSHMKNDKRMPLAKIYQAKIYTKMKDYYRADEIFKALESEKLKNKYARTLSIFNAENLLAWGKKEEAADELSAAYALNKNSKLRSRIAFLRGQILLALGKNEEARESFSTAYKKANDFEFEVKSMIEIAKSYKAQSDDYEAAERYLEKIGSKGIYKSRKNEFYYALGLMAKEAGKVKESEAFFQQSLKLKESDPQIRGLVYYEMGERRLKNDDYLGAGVYFDSAVAAMTYQPEKLALQKRAENIKKLSQNYYLIKKNDSILALTKMTDAERKVFFTKYIEKLKAEEAAEEAKMKLAQERNQNAETNSFSNIFGSSQVQDGFMDFGGKSRGFYFANAGTVSKGKANFKQIWGDRSLADNWRYSVKRISSIQDLKDKAMGVTEKKNSRRFEAAYYIEKIPTDVKEIHQLKKDRDTASLGLGLMYESLFADTKMANKTLLDLVRQNPEKEVKLQALYQLFSINYQKNQEVADRAKKIILDEFPYTPYAEFVRNPKRTDFLKSSPEVVNTYTEAYNLYEEEKYDESRTAIDAAMKTYSKDVLIPKFALLKAFVTGKTAGKEVMILQLQQIALNYPNTSEGEKAKEMLNYLKSDLDTPLEAKIKSSNSQIEKKKETQTSPEVYEVDEGDQEVIELENNENNTFKPPRPPDDFKEND